MKLPTLAAVLPNYNHAALLPRALDSLLNQSCPPTEIIVVDDASTDHSIEVIEKYCQRHPSIRLVRKTKNAGTILAMNEGLQQVTAECVHFPAADDYSLPGFYENTLRVLAEYPRAGVCSAICKVIDEQDRPQGVIPRPPYISSRPCYVPPEKALPGFLRLGGWYIGNTAVWRRTALMEIEDFNIKLGPFCDGFNFLHLSLLHGNCFIPEELGVITMSDNTISGGYRKDPERYLEVMRTAIRHMKDRSPDVFPGNFIQNFEGRILFSYGKFSLDQLKHSKERHWRELEKGMTPLTFWDRLGLGWLRTTSALGYWITTACLFLRFRKLSLPVLIQIFHRLRAF